MKPNQKKARELPINKEAIKLLKKMHMNNIHGGSLIKTGTGSSTGTGTTTGMFPVDNGF